MPLTSLSRNLLASSAVSAAVLCKYGGSIATVAISATLALAAYVLHRRPDGSLTIQDRCLINLDRLSSGMSPGRGTIACCLYFDASKVPTAAAARSAMKRALARYPRFASVAVETPSLEDSSFRACEVDLDAHVFEHAPIVGGSAALEERLNALINTDLPRGLPLWRWDLLPTADGASGAVLLRANHALADGLRLLGVGGEFLSFGSGAPATVDLARMTKGKLTRPKRSALGIGADLVEAATLDSIRAEDRTCFHTPDSLFPRQHPRTNVTASVPMDAVLKIKKAAPAAATVNDVVLCAFCGALRAYAEAVGEPITSPTLLRALCAVALPDDYPAGTMYNNFLMPSIALPVADADRAARLAAVQREMGRTKGSLAGFFMGKLLTIASRLGLDHIVGQTQNTIFKKHAFVYSNMPGFSEQVHFLSPSHPVSHFAVYFPNLVSQCLFVSYNGTLSFSLSTDAATVAKPQLLVDSFVAEVNAWARHP